MFIPDTGSDFFPSRIPDPNCLHPGSASKNLSILTQKKPTKWFLSSRKYDPGCSSRIPGSKRHRIPNPGSATLVYFDKVQTYIYFSKIIAEHINEKLGGIFPEGCF
jgi:hypothetical protein